MRSFITRHTSRISTLLRRTTRRTQRARFPYPYGVGFGTQSGSVVVCVTHHTCAAQYASARRPSTPNRSYSRLWKTRLRRIPGLIFFRPRNASILSTTSSGTLSSVFSPIFNSDLRTSSIVWSQVWRRRIIRRNHQTKRQGEQTARQRISWSGCSPPATTSTLSGTWRQASHVKTNGLREKRRKKRLWAWISFCTTVRLSLTLTLNADHQYSLECDN